MIGGERVVCVIPARAGSKGLKDKNIRPLGGRPLIAWSIDLALSMPEIDRVCVSTDGEAIAQIARARGAETLARPAELARDDSATADALRWHTRELRAAGDDFRYLLLLEPTTPFRAAADVRACLRLIHERRLDSVATFAPAKESPYWAFTIDDDVPCKLLEGGMTARQQLPPTWHLNGGAYVYVADRLPATGASLLFGAQGAVTMDRARSIDIDDALDLLFAEQVLAQGLAGP